MSDALARGVPATLTTVIGDSFRSVGADVTGAVAFVIGGPAVEGDRWHEALVELTGVLREHADHLAYGFIMRGWSVGTALTGGSRLDDWPQRADHRPRGAGWTKVSFEDIYAPDAFGVQLLGPGYADRVPDLDAWRTEALDGSAVLLEHTDLAAWFAQPFVPFREQLRREERSRPEILARARAELAPILYTSGVLADRFPDMGG